MVATAPRTHEEKLVLIAYVDEVAMRQERKGTGTAAGKSWPRI
jgi:hypothetical protein